MSRGLLILILIIGVLSTIGLFFALPGKETNELDQRDQLRFSNTQQLDAELSEYLPQNLDPSRETQTEAYFANIELPDPPTNTSTTTLEELELLHHYATTARDDNTIADIYREQYLSTFTMGPFSLKDTDHPHTQALILAAREEMAPVLFGLKTYFDRVRPSFLDPTLSTVIPVPDHPAYPSGHATEEYLYAHILSALDPTNRDIHFAEAARVARNREIAGVHYPSDTEAGRLLAEQFFPLFMESEIAQSLLPAASAEWE